MKTVLGSTGKPAPGIIGTGLMVFVLLAASSMASAAADPWEGWNRKVFAFNEFADKYVLKPIAKTYQWVAPDVVDDAVSNVFDNLDDVGNSINSLLQGKVADATSDVSRVLINSTIGIGGIFDVASRIGLDRHEEDFGQTMASWHIGSGPYLVLPFMGPSTLRDAIGRVPDAYSQPQRYLDHIPTRNTIYGVDFVDQRADLFAAEELVQGDRYTFIRDAYLQRRQFLVTDGELADEFTADDFDEEDY